MTTDTLFEQLKHPNPNLRERAMVELADTRDETTVPRLMAILGEEDITYRRSAVKALGVIGADAVDSLVESLLNSEDVTVRGSCAKALAQVAVNHASSPFPPNGLEGLATALNDENPVVHIASVMALGAIGQPAFAILVDALKTTDNLALQVAIINALGSMGEPAALQILQDLSQNESEDDYIKESANSALSRLEQVIKFKTL
ncbi:MAG: HEAT repeat domain-containing protein [Microcystaceae cyanobacterium]